MKFMVVEQAIGRIKEMVSKGNPYYIQEEQKCLSSLGKIHYLNCFLYVSY